MDIVVYASAELEIGPNVVGMLGKQALTLPLNYIPGPQHDLNWVSEHEL